MYKENFSQPVVEREKCNFEVGQGKEKKSFSLDKYIINPKEGVEVPLGIVPEDARLMEMYNNLPLVHKIIPGIPVPFVFLKQEGNKIYGNYTTREGQKEFADARANILDESFNPKPDIAELWEFSKMFKRNFPFDSTLAGLRSLDVVNNKINFGIAPCKYSRFFHTNRADGINLDLASADQEKWLKEIGPGSFDDLMKKASELRQKYPQCKTIGDIMKIKYPDLSEFNEHTRGDVIGVAGTVLTNDGNYVFVNRGKNVAINQGIYCTASGSADFNKDLLTSTGFQNFMGVQMERETKEELGFKVGNLLVSGMSWRVQNELGFEPDDFEIIPVGFLRELRQGASPESMFLIRYKGGVADVINSIKNNKHEGKEEIDRFVYTLPQEDMEKLITTPGADSIIKSKGLVNLMLINEYLKNKI